MGRANNAMIRLNGISFSYQSETAKTPIFDDFSFTLSPGDKTGLMGPNGSGKTTLLRLIMGLAKPDRGEILIFGKPRATEADFKEVRRRIGFVFQDADDQLFCPTVEEDIAFGPLNLGFSAKEARETAAEVLEKIGLPGYGQRITYNLSGGEKKLISLGTAIAMRPDMLILDEPTAGLDRHAEERLVQILAELNLPCLIVSHDQNFFAAATTSQMTLPPRKMQPQELSV